MADPSEGEEFKRGYRAAQLEQYGPNGVPPGRFLPGAEYRFRNGHFQSLARYERDVMRNLRHVQHLRWSDGEARIDQLEEEVKEELWVARGAVDDLIEEGLGRPEVVRAMRADPQRPAAVREFFGPAEAVADDPRRALPDWPVREDLSGADFGTRWNLENAFRRWETTSWRVSWMEETLEAYAIEALAQGSLGRVWILGKLQSFESARRALWEPMCHAMDERNSVIVAAEAVARVQREEEAPGRL